jgi:hypothetical protein
MRFAHPIIVAVSVLAGTSCGNKAEVNEARRSLYDTDFAIVYGATLEAVRELYPQRVDDDPATGKIGTVWTPVQYSNAGAEDPKSVQMQDRALGYDQSVGQPGGLGSRTSVGYKRYFIRFDVTVAGGRPWRVRVVGHAQEWEPGNAVAVDLKGVTTPHWLPGRTDALVVAIHKKLKKYAIARPEAVEEVIDAPPPIDVTAYGPIPPEAGERIGALRNAIRQRDIETLREHVAADVVWSLGASPGVDAALVMWKADPAILDSMMAAIEAGCRGTQAEVVCPPDATETPGYTGWRLTLTKRAEGWRVTGFVQGD